MKKLFLLGYAVLAILTINAQTNDVVYATNQTDGTIQKVSVNPITGVSSGNFTTVKSNLEPSAALGANNSGWLYYLEYGGDATASGNGKVDIYAIKMDGTGTQTKIASNFDMNGTSNSDIDFVRLGVASNGTAWILAKSSTTSTLYLASFQTNGNSIVTPSRKGTATTSDANNEIFANGDISFDGVGNMYALANDGNGNTKMYGIKTADLQSTTSTSNITLNYKWLLKKADGSNFTGTVNGNAFSSTGSMYISTGDGLYFIDQTTVNTLGVGTVQCKLIKSQSNLTDLATGYWPTATALPVKFANFKLTLIKH